MVILLGSRPRAVRRHAVLYIKLGVIIDAQKKTRLSSSASIQVGTTSLQKTRVEQPVKCDEKNMDHIVW